MSTTKLKEEVEKMRTLISLKKRLCEDAYQGDNSEMLKEKITVTQEELLKSTYRINKIVKEIETKI